MSNKIGRNDPCPCGSGEKYKKCCLKKGLPNRDRAVGAPGRFRFEAGAYGREETGYVPAALSLQEVDGAWQPQFLLANPMMPFDSWPQAAEVVTHHLDAAFAAKSAGGTDRDAALKLHSFGYKSVEDFRLEDFRALEPGMVGLGGALDAQAPDVADDAFPSGFEHPQGPRETFLHVVDEQIRLGEPAETGLTFERLVDAGMEEHDAKSLIAMLVAAETFEMMKEDRAFDEGEYVRRLRRLPELPESLR